MKKLIFVSLLLLVSSATQAHHKRDYAKARVIEVTPVYEYIKVPNHDKSYRQGRKPYYRQQDFNGAPIIGSVIGGTIGHATSDRKHKFIGTLAGAIIGGAIGHHIDKKQQIYSRSYSQHGPRSHQYKKQRVLRGYDVIYKFKGKLYETFSRDKPRKYIRIYR